jgi:putative PIN family toxin of toxin-antitoxin system
MIERVVFDTSTLIGAALKFGSKPHQALTLALGSCVICICEQELAELAEVLNRSSLERYLTRSDRDRFLALIRERTQIVEIDEMVGTALDPPCRDPKDNFILALSIAARASVIVSSDHDLLVLHPWRGIPVLSPAQFVSQFLG